jgi:predicted Zn-dependent protease with MMP-like domain
MKSSDFEKLILNALENLPEKFKKKIQNVEIVIEEQPSKEVLRATKTEAPAILLGLYQGTPLPKRSSFSYTNVLPDKITLYRKSFESLFPNDEKLREKVREVLLHELGHYFGLSEKELRE